MATSEKTIIYLLDILSSLKTVRVRKMFGEYALYMNDKVVGLICDDQIFIKFTDKGKQFAQGRFEEGSAYPGAKPSMNITDYVDDSQFFSTLVELTYTALPNKQKVRKSG